MVSKKTDLYKVNVLNHYVKYGKRGNLKKKNPVRRNFETSI